MGCGAQEENIGAALPDESVATQSLVVKRPNPQEFDPATSTDASSRVIKLDFQNCIFCEACARVCSDYEAQGIIQHSTNQKVPYIGKNGQYLKLATTDCISCGQCALSCPNGCITIESEWEELKSLNGLKYAIISPSLQAYFKNYNLVEILQRNGFTKVFISATGVDLLTEYEARAIINARKQGRFLISTMCPSFVEYVERSHSWFLPFLSINKSPAQLLSAVIKGYLAKNTAVVHFTSCTARKAEIVRKDLYGECDGVITAPELQLMIHKLNAKPSELKYSFSPPFDQYTRSAFAHELPGSISEALARQIFEMYSDDFDLSKVSVQVKEKWDDNDESIKVVSFQTGSQEFAFGVASGGVAVKKALEMLRSGELKVDYLEAFMCPLGCINGGGSVVDYRFAEVCKRADDIKAIQREISQESPAECQGVCEYLKQSQSQTQLRSRGFVEWE